MKNNLQKYLVLIVSILLLHSCSINKFIPEGERLYTGAKIEIFCLEPFESTVEQALNTTSKCVWQCMVGNLKRFKPTDILELEIAGVRLQARLKEKREQDVLIEFNWDGSIVFSEILQEAGELPLPPYLNRKTEEKDEKSYQTVYAKNDGAVAAPTAGLHFVDSQLADLKNQGHDLAYLTLFVGAGTFKPVKADKLVDHEMHRERIVIQKSTLEQLANKKGKIITVGTTSLRSLESLYWLAVKMKSSENDAERFVNQNDAYELNTDINWQQACEYILLVLKNSGETSIDFYSGLFVMPGYDFKVIDGLITNFHQPKSTLLSLVSAWIGKDWEKVYSYALENDFRFLSYGDNSLLLR